MPRKIALVALGMLTIFNIAAMVLNTPPPSHAAVAGMKYPQLLNDPDFSRAVKSLVEHCKVDVDLGTLKC